MDVKTVPLNQLKINAAINARNGNAPNVLDLVASIGAIGLTHALAVRRAGEDFEIIDGKRRLAALNRLADAGIIAHDYAVPVLVRDDDDRQAREASLAANVIREDLSPYEEAVAFTRLHEDGDAPEHIAAHFGVPLRRVEQRLAIGSLPQPILEALRDGEITAEAAQAFTLSRDAKEQLKVFKGGNLHPHSIKSALVNKAIAADSAEAAYVGPEAYLAAGGTIRSDLFSQDAWFESGKVLGKAFEKKLKDEESRLKAEGWSFVIIERDQGSYKYSSWSRLDPKGETARYKAIDKEIVALELKGNELEARDADTTEIDIQIDALEREQDRLRSALFTDKQKAMSGVLIKKGFRQIETIFGIVKPGDAKRAKAAEAAEAKSTRSKQKAKTSSAKAGNKDDHEEADLAGALQSELSLELAGILQIGMTEKPHAAFYCLMAAMIGEACESFDSPLNITGRTFAPVGKNAAHETFAKEFKDMLADFRPKGRHELDFAATVAKLEAMEPLVVTQLLAMLAAAKIDIAGHITDANVRALIDRIDPDVGAHWKAGKDFFARLTRPQLAEAIADVEGEAGFARASSKKPELVAHALKVLVPHGWLPKLMRPPSYAGPGSKTWKAPAPLRQAAE